MKGSLRLGDHCTKIGSGATPRGGKSCYLPRGPFCLIRSQNVLNDRFNKEGLAYISEEQARRLDSVEVRKGDVLLNITGDSVARVCQVADDALPARVNQHVAIIRPDPATLDPRYLRYFMVTPKFQDFLMSMASSGATRNALTKGMIKNFEIPYRPVEEQRDVGALLGALDDKIELNRRMGATLEEMARALYRSWFVDFDPVHARALGQPPAHMDATTAALFPDRFEPDGLPRGWHFSPLDSMAHVTMGLSPKGSTYNGSGKGVPLCNGPAEYGNFFLRKVKWTTAATRLAQHGDLILCVRGSTTGRHSFADAEYCLGRGVAGIRGLSDSHEFVEVSMLSSIDRLLEKAVGSVFPSLSKNDIAKFEIINPNADLIRAYCSIARPLREKVWANHRENETLLALRETLLPRLMTGELSIRDAGKWVEEVV